MSYRDLRNFTEMMRALGYPRLISMENFRSPNFPLVAEILTWLVNRYDPMADIPNDIDTEQDRVIFIKSAAQFMATKAHIKLNTKKLYSADGYAVKELLKIATVLYSAMRTNQSEKDASQSELGPTAVELSTKATDLKACRQLGSEITARGAKLYELLGKEVDLRDLRKTAISRAVDIDEIDRGVQRSISLVNGEVQRTTERIENLASDEANLEMKIEKKKQELERNQKRLRSLANVRPAFMEEFEKLEVELGRQYEVYMERHRNLSYLEHQLEDYQRLQQSELQETEGTLRRMQQRMEEAEKRMIHDDILTDEMMLIASSEFTRPKDGRRLVGSMTGEGLGSEDEDSGSLSSSSGLPLGPDDGGLDGLGEEEEDEEEDEEEEEEEEEEEDDQLGSDDNF